MTALIKCSNLLFFESILEFISDEDIAFTFGYEVDLIVFWIKFVILVAKMGFRGLEHGFHTFDDVVDDVGIVSLVGVYVLFFGA